MKRKIGLISEHASPLATLGGVDSGGQNVYVGELARQLGELGYLVDVFTRWDDPRMPQIITWSNNVRVIHIKAGPIAFIRKEDLLQYMDEFTENVIGFAESDPYQLFHANFWMSGLVACQIKARLGIPFVITFHALGKIRLLHQGKADQFPSQRLEIEQQIVQEADQIIAECPQDQEDLIAHYHADANRITIIPCGINPQQFHPVDPQLARMMLNLDPSEKLILQLGRMVPRKGVETVIEALAILIKRCQTKARLLIVGGDSDQPDPVQTPEIGRLVQIAQTQGVGEWVTFIGRKGRDQLKYYYSAADVFVSTPWYEPFGMTPLEAMACGTPVIGSRVGGIKYSVVDGKTGFLVPPKTPLTLAEKLHEVLTQPQLHQIFRQNAIRRVSTHFTWTRVGQAVATLYEKVLTRNRGEGQIAIIERSFTSSLETIRKSHELLRLPILKAAQAIAEVFTEGGKVLICGNGGSASQAQHFAAEFVGRFMDEQRPGLPVIALTADTSILTAWSNDYSYDRVFARQVEAYGKSGDLVIGLSTSGNSANVIKAFQQARAKNITTIAILGKSGGELIDHADLHILVPSYDTQRIQELHIQILHILCELVETALLAQTPIETASTVRILPIMQSESA
ncbi:MAG: D-sedoheptulose 7-phosphate isomerase [Anaerolineae bacterium]|jgi:phosphoheptose isomerase|nr:D-sedoheptulose 7-phosphate isomerase [Anaerolineae bacterium]